MKFGIGFFVGLLTGVTIILGPVIAVVAAVILRDESPTTKPASAVVDDVPESLPETDLSTAPEYKRGGVSP